MHRTIELLQTARRSAIFFCDKKVTGVTADADRVTETFDVIVVGGGGSGLAAAVSCAERGLRVLLLEKQQQLGGTTGIAVGSFTANGTRHQQRNGVRDNPQHHNHDAGLFAAPEIEAAGNSELREFFLSHSAETLQWLEGMGLAFHGPSPEPPNRVPRMHNVVPNAKAYIGALQMRLLRLHGAVVTDACVTQLLCLSPNDINDTNATRDGSAARVNGVAARVRDTLRHYHAKLGVILAAGDYANNSDMIAAHKGDRFATVEGINPHAQGDGHRLVSDVGGQLLNMQITYGPEFRFVPPPGKPFVQLLPSSGWPAAIMGRLLPLVPKRLIHAFVKRLLVTWQHPEDSLFQDGAVLVNADGRRFCDEHQSPEREIAVAQQPSKQAWLLLDEFLIQRYQQWPHFISTAPEIAYAYVADYLRLRPDVAVCAASLSKVAELAGLPPDALQATVAARDNGSQVPAVRRPLQGQQWVLLGPIKAYFTTTEGGAAIDQSFRVLTAEGQPISGLYAVGQNGLGGQILWGHGLHIAWAITSGRMVGEVLAQKARG